MANDLPQVGLWPTCLSDFLRPQVALAALSLLEKCGFPVFVPEYPTCCGQPGYNNGDFQNLQSIAHHWARTFAHCQYVVVPSGSCAGMMRRDYLKLLQDDDPQRQAIEAFSEKVHELTQFLVHVVPTHTCARPLVVKTSAPWTATYHDSCSGLRELGIQSEPRALLARCPHITLVENPQKETCCGFGGTFSLKMPDISEQMAQKKCQAIPPGVNVLIGGDLGCLLHMESWARRQDNAGESLQCRHIAEVLDEAYHDAPSI